MALSTAADPKRPATRLILCNTEFCARLRQAAAGERIVYHRGHLAVDRMTGPSRRSEKARDELNRVADRAWSLAQPGLLILAQQRHDAGDDPSVAIRACPPGTPSVTRLSPQTAVAAQARSGLIPAIPEEGIR